MNDLQAAISKAELAVSLTPENHPDRAEWLNALASRSILSDEKYGRRTGGHLKSGAGGLYHP